MRYHDSVEPTLLAQQIGILSVFFFFFNDTATTEIYTLSLHDALPICRSARRALWRARQADARRDRLPGTRRSEEHTSELQSRLHLVCRLLLEKKKNRTYTITHICYKTVIKRHIRIAYCCLWVLTLVID